MCGPPVQYTLNTGLVSRALQPPLSHSLPTSAKQTERVKKFAELQNVTNFPGAAPVPPLSNEITSSVSQQVSAPGATFSHVSTDLNCILTMKNGKQWVVARLNKNMFKKIKFKKVIKTKLTTSHKRAEKIIQCRNQR